MSTQITTAFVNQFSANIALLSQQTASKLRKAVRVESVTGEKAFFDQVGSAAAVKKTSRHADTPLVTTPHSRRMATMTDYIWADLIDDQDKLRMLADPTSTYAQAASSALGRAMDDEIITAAIGTAKTGASGSTSTTLPAGQKVAHGSAGLTIAKLISAKKILDANDVDPSIKRWIAVSERLQHCESTRYRRGEYFCRIRVHQLESAQHGFNPEQAGVRLGRGWDHVGLGV